MPWPIGWIGDYESRERGGSSPLQGAKFTELMGGTRQPPDTKTLTATQTKPQTINLIR